MVGHITGKNQNLPILSHVLLKTEGGNLKLSSTNLEIAVSVLVRGRVEADGECAAPAKLLLDYVSLLPAGKVELVFTQDALEVRADGNVTSIKTMPASEFPLIPKLAKGAAYHLDADALRQAIGQVAFAVSASDARPELSGVSCTFHGQVGVGKLVMAATDSYRLSERTLTLAPGSVDTEARLIVPARTLLEVGRILSGYKDEMTSQTLVEWAVTESQLVVTFGNVELVSRLIEGSFPDYRQIIPTQFKAVIQVRRADLAKAIRAASLFARQGLFDVHLALSADGQLKISSADTGVGSHSTTLSVQGTFQDQQVTINYKYMNDGLAAMGTEQVTIHLIDSMNPLVVRPAQDEEGFQYIVMPIRA